MLSTSRVNLFRPKNHDGVLRARFFDDGALYFVFGGDLISRFGAVLRQAETRAFLTVVVSA